MGVNRIILSKDSDADVKITLHHLVVPNSFFSHYGLQHLFQSNMLPWRLAGSESDAEMEEMYYAVLGCTTKHVFHLKKATQSKMPSTTVIQISPPELITHQHPFFISYTLIFFNLHLIQYFYKDNYR